METFERGVLIIICLTYNLTFTMNSQGHKRKSPCNEYESAGDKHKSACNKYESGGHKRDSACKTA